MVKQAVAAWVLIFSGILSSGVSAQQGGIRGAVMDQDFEVPLPGVKVVVSESGQETATDDSGSYYLENIEPGAYTLLFSKGGYTRSSKPGVVVSPGQLAEVVVELAGEYEEMDELVVRDIQLGGASEIGLLNLRMESSSLMDSVGSDLMGQAGVSDAAQALNLVPGTTVQDGKYAVVRGLPDRYVSSQMNGVRLPSADPDKRAVQLDQFPSALIESIQVSKTFTPDQQGDASGGAVNVVLKGIPEESVLKLKLGTKYNDQVFGEDNFLTYKGGGVNFWGRDDGTRVEQPTPGAWSGAVGHSKEEAPIPYDWSVTAGGKKELFDGVRVGGLGNFYYKRDASHYEGGVDEKWWVRNGMMVPAHSGGGNNEPDDPLNVGAGYKTSLYDISQSSEEVQWGGLGAVGIETDHHALKLLYMKTHTAEDKVTLAEDTKGKDYFVTRRVPGYDPLAPNLDYRDAAPYRRNQTLAYTERDTDTLQLSGNHTLPLPEFGRQGVFLLLQPELDWTIAQSTSELYSPDKRLFGSVWLPEQPEQVILGGRNPIIIPAIPENYYPDVPVGGESSLGNLQRVWENIVEDSEQYFLNGKVPFENWTEDEGALKVGLFNDRVKRKYTKESYSNKDDKLSKQPELAWNQYWSDFFPSENHIMEAAEVDADYDGEQDISAWYWMADVPLASFVKMVGGMRYESTDLDITIVDPESEVYWVDPDNPGALAQLKPGDADVDYSQQDVLPSLGFEFSLLEKLTVRTAYSETVARQTFKELTPIQQQEYLGADIFIGNPELQMSALENYDFRVDYAPYPGGLFSVSWFKKYVDKPIEYTQGFNDNIGRYTTAVNYPGGELTGYELELRQQLDQFWDPLAGLALGANATFIDSEVTLSAKDAADLKAIGYPEPTRDMLNAPEYLYNLNLTYDIEKSGTQLGLFYVVKGDTLVAGSATGGKGSFIPSIYAKESATLNFTVSQDIGKQVKLSFKAKNLTNPDIQEVYRSRYIAEDVVKKSYQKGIEYSIGVSAVW